MLYVLGMGNPRTSDGTLMVLLVGAAIVVGLLIALVFGDSIDLAP